MTQFKSFKDFAYQHAVTSDTTRDQAQYAIEKIAGFPETIPEDIKAEMVEGYRLRHSEIKKPVTYAVINGHYVIATPEQISFFPRTYLTGLAEQLDHTVFLLAEADPHAGRRTGRADFPP